MYFDPLIHYTSKNTFYAFLHSHIVETRNMPMITALSVNRVSMNREIAHFYRCAMSFLDVVCHVIKGQILKFIMFLKYSSRYTIFQRFEFNKTKNAYFMLNSKHLRS